MCACRSPSPHTFAQTACAVHLVPRTLVPVWDPRRGCVAATQSLLLVYKNTIGAFQQPQSLLLLYNNTIGAVPQPQKLVAVSKQHIWGCETSQASAGNHRIWHEGGRERSVRAETLSCKSCAPQDASRMPRLLKKQKICQKQPNL